MSLKKRLKRIKDNMIKQNFKKIILKIQKNIKFLNKDTKKKQMRPKKIKIDGKKNLHRKISKMKKLKKND